MLRIETISSEASLNYYKAKVLRESIRVNHVNDSVIGGLITTENVQRLFRKEVPFKRRGNGRGPH